MDPVSQEYVSFLIKDRPVSETSELYNEWRDNYDKAMENVSYYGPLVTAISFSELGLCTELRILDVGAGTGKLGQEVMSEIAVFLLKNRGYTNIDALDPSNMVNLAKEDQIYKHYIRDYVQLGHILQIEKDTYDVAIMTGVLTPGHIHVEDLLEITKILKPGGLVCWTCTTPGYYVNDNSKYSAEYFEKVIAQYINDGIWDYYQKPKIVQNYYRNSPGYFYSMKTRK